MDLLPKELPYEIKLEIFKYTDLGTCLKLNIKDAWLLDFLYKKENIKCYKDVKNYEGIHIPKVLEYAKNKQILELKPRDFNLFCSRKIDLTDNFNKLLITLFSLDATQINEFEKLLYTPDFGASVTMSIPRSGDLFGGMYFNIEL